MHDSLDDLLAEAASQKAKPSSDLMSRVMADAVQFQPQAQVFERRTAIITPKAGIIANLAEVFGGRSVLAGMASVALAGIYLGAMQPAFSLGISTQLSQDTPFESVELIPGFDTLLAGE